MTEPAAEDPLRELELCVPHDWIDLLADGPQGEEADLAARERFFDLVGATYPAAERVDIEAGTEALLAWRAAMIGRGAVSHGIVSCPVEPAATHPDGRPRRAEWQIMSAIVTVPAGVGDLDTGELLARLMGAQLDPESTYVESFETDIGCGVGLMLQPVLTDPGLSIQAALGIEAAESRADAEPALRYGLAAALASPVSGGYSLLVTGICLDPDQLREMAALVAVIAGRSHFLG